MPFTHQHGQYLDCGDAQIYFEECGNPAGHPLLLLHGGLGCLLDFNPLLEKLPPDWRLIGMDLRGHGRSTLGRSPLSYQGHQRDVAALCHHLGLSDVALLGFSDGGITALRLAAEQPAACALLITLGSQWRLRDGDPATDLLRSIDSAQWEAWFPEAVAHYRRVNPLADFERLVAAVVALWLDASEHGYPGERVRAIQAPTLLIRGDQDFLLSLDELAQLQARVPHAHLLNAPFARHDVHNEAVELVAAAVNTFLRQPQRQTAPA